MSVFRTIISGLFGGYANHQGKGSQIAIPSSSVHDESPVIGIDGALQISAVWRAAATVVDTISSLPIKLLQVNAGERKLVNTGATYNLLSKKTNPYQVPQEFWSYMLLNRLFRGNAFARKVKNSTGETVSLMPLSADQMQVDLLDDGVILYTYTVDNKSFIFTGSDIVHIKGGLNNGIVGLAQLEYMRTSLGLAVNAQNHTTKTYRKEARRPGILMSEHTLKKEQRERLRENFSEITTGGKKELFILEADFKFQPLGMTPADLQLLETRKFSIEEIARWFGVPAVLLGASGETTALGSSVSEIIRTFYKLTIRPELTMIQAILNDSLLTPAQRSQGHEVEFDPDALLMMDPKDRMELQSKSVQNGLRTRNEWRVKDGLERMEGGDTLTAQSNLAPLDMLGKINTGGGNVPEEPIKQ